MVYTPKLTVYKLINYRIKFGMKMNMKKTKTIVVSRKGEISKVNRRSEIRRRKEIARNHSAKCEQ